MKISYNLLLTVALLFCGSAYAQDWPNLQRYREADEKLKDSTVSAVYIGDSITDFWINKDPAFFKAHNYVDRGISGQTSPQMLLRFRQDVIDLHPKAVVILSGASDISLNTGPMTADMTQDNIKSMTELAEANKIKVVLCSILPAIHYPWRPDVQPADSVIALNAWIKNYAKEKHLVYADYYSVLVSYHKGMGYGLAEEDGVHPNLAATKRWNRSYKPHSKKYNKSKKNHKK